eukprot:CAMPEP_0174695244 /NCGR_PEP_ID=MMETSP1094-20130205/1665_1 /TAXON_ID=156173 /ORGANISM="Chrysochromulina brevifilum, Strain UTEX LB 985" /LENGTH=567 /DNA_ID=CAMNT_0015891693 /DNA_START=50 /DNA_END=1753 /DNA_ORIENTATION=-
MPQEIPAWKDYQKVLTIIRKSKLNKAKKNEFESMSELDELFRNFDAQAFTAGKAGQGTLTFNEAKNGILTELKDRTKLKHSDNLVVDTVAEAIRRGFKVTRSMGGAGSEMDREEFRLLLVFLERYFTLLDMYKVVELEKDKPARVKSGGDERPLRVGQLDFARSIPKLKEWGLTIGPPAQAFTMLAGEGKTMITFDEFAAWSVGTSMQYVEPEPEEEEVDYAAEALKAKKELDRKERKKKAAQEKKRKEAEAKKKALEESLGDVEAVGGAGQYIRPGSSLAVTTSANVVSDYGLGDVSLYDLDGDGELDVGKEQDMAREAHKKAVKARMKAEADALRKQNAELKKKRDHMRYVADAGVMEDEIDYMNDDDEDKDFWLNRHKLWQENKERQARETQMINEENKVYRMRLKQTGFKVDDWTRESMVPIEQRLKEEKEAAGLIAQIRSAVQGMLANEPASPTTLALTSGATINPGTSPELSHLEPKLQKANDLINSDFKLTFNEQHFVMKDRPHLPAHQLFSGGTPIKEDHTHTSVDGTTIKYIQGKPAAVHKNGEPQIVLALETVLYDT